MSRRVRVVESQYINHLTRGEWMGKPVFSGTCLVDILPAGSDDGHHHSAQLSACAENRMTGHDRILLDCTKVAGSTHGQLDS